MNYPSMMTDRLASGKPLVGLNPLLVSDTGDNLIPDGTSKSFKFSKKIIDSHGRIYSTDNGTTWLYIDFGYGENTDNNYSSTRPTGEINIFPYTSSNPIANITSPLATLQVSNYCKATNSHSIYKGNNITQLLNKVAVGNGDKGLVSKVVEDVEIGSYDIEIVGNSTVSLVQGVTTVKIKDNSFTYANKDELYLRIASSYTGILGSASPFNDSTVWERVIGATTPNHSTIDLDNSDSPAIKYLSTIATNDDGELAYQIIGTELVYNGTTSSYDGDDSEFTQLTNGSIDDTNSNTAKTVVATLNLGRFK